LRGSGGLVWHRTGASLLFAVASANVHDTAFQQMTAPWEQQMIAPPGTVTSNCNSRRLLSKPAPLVP
jgi:hypothetical protein